MGQGKVSGAVHTAAAKLVCKRAMIGTEWANFRPGCMNRCRKRYSHPLEGSFLAGNAAWALSGYLPTENTDYSRISEQRTLWEWVFCPLFGGCPYLGGSIV